MKGVKRFFFYGIPKKLIAVCLLLLTAVLLLPVYRLALYATPYYDDFNYAVTVKQMYEASPSLLTAVKEAAWVAKVTYLSWQGTYSSVFMMALMPAAFGMNLYFIGIAAIVTFFVAGTFFLSFTLLRKLFGASGIDALIASLLVTLTQTQLIHSAQQGIYWYNAAVHYTFAHSVMFIMIAVSVLCITADKKSIRVLNGILLILLSAFVAGTNFVTALQGFPVLFIVAAAAFVLKRRAKVWLAVSLAVYLAGLIVSVTAPGNSARQILYEGVSKGPVEAILLSFKSAFTDIGKFSGLIIFAVIISLIPVFTEIVKGSSFSFKYPWVFTLLSFCFYATGFTPSWYGMGSEGLARTLCVVKSTFLFLLIANEFYWTGFICAKKKNPETAQDGNVAKNGSGHYWFLYAAVLLIVLVSFVVEKDKAGSFLSYGAYYYIHTGEAYNYYVEQLERDKTIRESGADVELSPLVWRPWFLCKKEDLSDNPEAEQNRAAARWYGKRSIYVSGEQ